MASVEKSSRWRPAFRIDESLKRVAQMLLYTAGGLGSWSVGDLLLGLYYLRRYKTNAYVPKPIGEFVVDKELLDTALRYTIFALAAYKQTLVEVIVATDLKEENIIAFEAKSTLKRSGYVLVRDDKRQEIILSVRGTRSAKDALVDACASASPFLHGYCHHGVLSSAQWFVENLRDVIVEQHKKYPDYRIVTTGHSLGGATATIVCLLLREELHLDVLCYAFAPPPSCDAVTALAAAEAGAVVSFVHGHDFVARASLHSLEALRLELRAYDWMSEAKDDIKKKKLVAGAIKATSAATRAAGTAMSTVRDSKVGRKTAEGVAWAASHPVVTKTMEKGRDAMASARKLTEVFRDTSAAKKKSSSASRSLHTSDEAETEAAAAAADAGFEMIDAAEVDGEEWAKEETKIKIKKVSRAEQLGARRDVPLVTVGRVYHIYEIEDRYVMREEQPDVFSTFSLHDTMFEDHGMLAYVAALRSIRAALPDEPVVEARAPLPRGERDSPKR